MHGLLRAGRGGSLAVGRVSGPWNRKLADGARRAQAYLTWSVDVHSSLSAVHGRQLRRAALRIVEHFRMRDRSDPVAMTESLSALGGRELHLDVRESSRRYRCSVRRSTGATGR